MKTEKWMPMAAFAALLVTTTSCQDWGQQDPVAGNQVYPTLQNVAKFDFQDEEGLDPTVYRLVANPGGETPQVVDDEEKGKVLEVSNGSVSVSNPLSSVVLQNAASLTFWLKVNGTESLSKPLIAFADETGSAGVSVAADGSINYAAADGNWSSAGELADYVTPDEWHFMAIVLANTGYTMTVDGENTVSRQVTDFDCSKMVAVANAMPELRIGSADNSTPFYIDDLTVFRNTITEKETGRPALTGGSGAAGNEAVAPVYFISFDAGLNGASIVGGGEIIYKGGAFGNVFSNAMDGMRENFLKLPSDALSSVKETGELTISVWMNKGNETDKWHYMWSPVFSAYGDNGTNNPMFTLEYRGLPLVNTEQPDNTGAAYCDFTDNEHDNGQVILYHGDNDYLDDGNWHLYTLTLTANNAITYIDGEVANSWTLDGSRGQVCDMDAISQLSNIALGGNQAWGWGDPDPGFYFDDLAIYNKVLSQEQIKTIISLKNTMYANTFSNGADDMNKQGAGEFIENSTPGFGSVFSNAMDGMRSNYLKLPSDALSSVKETGELTISMWLNKGNETDKWHYMWSPVFSAYGDNGTGNPMFALEYRGLPLVNTEQPDNTGAAYCDFTNNEHDNGEVIVYHGDNDYLDDGNWHLYTLTLTANNAITYIDGEVANSWTLDGSRGQVCDMDAISQLTNICLGGNQAWDWGDPDPGFYFDDIFLYNRVLTQDEIKQLMLLKK